MEKTIFEVLRDDHDSQRALIAELLSTRGDEGECRSLFDSLRKEMKAHAQAEERVVYSRLLRSPMLQGKIGRLLQDHREIDALAAKLDGSDVTNPVWYARLVDLCDRALHHMAREEAKVFVLASQVLDADERRSLAADYEREKRLEICS